MISNKVEYLVLTLMDLAAHRDDGFSVTREVAERQHIPANYMPQIMAILTKKGWVHSARGPGGGVRLAVDPSEITIKDVIDASEDPFLLKACAEAEYACAKKPRCPLRKVWLEAQQRITGVMRETTVADLIS